MEKPAGNWPRRFSRRRNEMWNISIFLPMIVVTLDVKVKVIWKVIIRKRR
jgi:hypothetical protein